MAANPKARVRVIAGLTRAGIVARALDVIDRDGLDAFSMRRLATELGVQVGALYVHIADRETLLAEVTGLMVVGVTPPDPDDWATGWQEWLREFAHRWRRALQNHPLAAPLVGSLVSNSADDFTMVETVLRGLQGAGFQGDDLIAAYDSYVGLVIGFIVLEFAQPPQNVDRWRERRRGEVAAVTAEAAPLVVAHRERMTESFVIRWLNGADAPMDTGFATALDVVISGLESRLATQR